MVEERDITLEDKTTKKGRKKQSVDLPPGYKLSTDGKLIPEFKPGKEISASFGNTRINAHIDWAATLREILSNSEYSLESLAKKLKLPVESVEKLLYGDTSGVGFHEGAQLLSIHRAVLIEAGYPVEDELV